MIPPSAKSDLPQTSLLAYKALVIMIPPPNKITTPSEGDAAMAK
jgi:hypothetical protein